MGLATTIAVIAGVGYATKAFGDYKAGKEQQKAARTAALEQERQGAAERRAAESAAALSDYNAAVSELQATDAVERGADEESRYRTQVRGIIGQQRAAFAGGNVDVGFGSALDVQADAAFLGEMDALQIRTNAAREQWGHKVEAVDYRMRAEITRKEGANLELAAQAQARGTRAQGNAASTAGKFAAAGTLLGGGSSLLQMRYAFKN